VTPSSFSRTCAFGLLNRPLSTKTVEGALRRAKFLFLKGRFNRARRLICHTLSLDVVFSPRLIKVPHWDKQKYRNSMLRKAIWDVSPVWKTAPSNAWKRAGRLSVLFGTIAKFGSDANIVHDLVRLAVHCWTMSLKDFRGLCNRIEKRCVSISNVVGSNIKMPETTLRIRALSAFPGLPENVARSHLRRFSAFKYGVNHRPSSLGGALMLLNVKKRVK